MILDKNNPETWKQKMLGTLKAEVLERNGIPWQGLGNKWAIGSKQKKNGFHCPLPFAKCGLTKFLDTDPDKRRKQGSNKQ